MSVHTEIVEADAEVKEGVLHTQKSTIGQVDDGIGCHKRWLPHLKTHTLADSGVTSQLVSVIDCCSKSASGLL